MPPTRDPLRDATASRATHTTTYALMDPWAQTFPWDCFIRPDNGCISADHAHSPMAGDPCAVKECRQPLRDREVCYAVVQLPRGDRKRIPWVCWRHVHPDTGPLYVKGSP